jgi:predicted metal-dependent HD superfamily phosphohydrolase
MDFEGARRYIVDRLHAELNPSLHYHSVGHTLDVHASICRLAAAEGIAEEESLLLQTAALYHDAGMIIRYRDHESTSADLAGKVLPGYGYTPNHIELIRSLIMVTKLPQRALTPLEEIICDADLDYLGRADFFIGSFRLRLEWEENGINHFTLPEWFQLQINFLTDHQYFTTSARTSRQHKKEENLQQIIQLLREPQ